jgi:hypothetical protein
LVGVIFPLFGLLGILSNRSFIFLKTPKKFNNFIFYTFFVAFHNLLCYVFIIDIWVSLD